MIRSVVVILALVMSMYAQAPKRPAILGFSDVAFYSTNLDATNRFYTGTLGYKPTAKPGEYQIGKQLVENVAQTPPTPHYLLAHISFLTASAEQMRKYLAANGVEVPKQVQKDKDGSTWFEMKDPEGVAIRFVDRTAKAAKAAQVSSQIIHVGFVVHDRDKEDKLYRDLLGFKPYWHGGMEEGRTDWIAMQVPDGRQWIEYMMVHDNSPLSPHQLGVMNHYSLGVNDIHDAEKFLAAHGWTPTNESKVQMGKDGKYQLNVYDPDGSRIEFMEFTPKEKPCCSDFTAPHPAAE